jgi:hypothetical protein
MTGESSANIGIIIIIIMAVRSRRYLSSATAKGRKKAEEAAPVMMMTASGWAPRASRWPTNTTYPATMHCTSKRPPAISTSSKQPPPPSWPGIFAIWLLLIVSERDALIRRFGGDDKILIRDGYDI